MLNPLIKQVPVVGQAYGFTKTAMKIYNSTSPVEAVKVAAVSISTIVSVELKVYFYSKLFDFKCLLRGHLKTR